MLDRDFWVLQRLAVNKSTHGKIVDVVCVATAALTAVTLTAVT